MANIGSQGGTYADIAERDAAIATIKQQCRELITEIQRSLGGTGEARFTTMPVWIDGVWGDYWYCELDGSSVGDLFYDGYGPVPKGDALGSLIFCAQRESEVSS